MVGQPPDFVDGHHHVHQFPVVRDKLLELMRERYTSRRPYLRVSGDRVFRIVRRGVGVARALAIASLGFGTSKLATRHGIRTNHGFCGVYDFDDPRPYGDLVRQFFRTLGPRSIFMCHPGEYDAELEAVDQLVHQREVELAYLASDEFAELLVKRNLVISRFDTESAPPG
tara:strand:- start:354 stop:863 length:510 start_codon:yes stop_codon:yes gene_type:complete